MGYNTKFTGRITITPPLNADEIAFLTRFSNTRRMLRGKGPYYVDSEAFMGQDVEPDILDSAEPPEGQPGLWCHWLLSADGTEFVVDDGREKFYDAERWMLYLIDTFLRPGATVAGELRDPLLGRVYAKELPAFTFDHVLNGMFEAQGEYREDVWRLIVRDNAVSYQDGTHGRDGQVSFDGPEVPVTLAEGRPDW